jgi:predicted lipoprotein with Yx(FWY)xxD motif
LNGASILSFKTNNLFNNTSDGTFTPPTLSQLLPPRAMRPPQRGSLRASDSNIKEFLMIRIVIAIAAAAALTTPAFAQTAPQPLSDWRGMTLYTSDRDTATASNCNGLCAATWPPMFAAADSIGTGNWSVITRSDGAKQWTYKGKPLYTFRNDTKPGDINGAGQDGNTWHTAVP